MSDLIDRIKQFRGLSEAGSVCKHYSSRFDGICIPGCKKLQIPKGGPCPWGEDKEWDEASEDCPCYKVK